MENQRLDAERKQLTMRTVGSGSFVYQEVKDWAKFPDGWTAEDAPGVAVDSADRVHVLVRKKDGLLVFDRDGQFRKSWGEDLFGRPHGLFIDPDNYVYVVDDWGHSIFKFTPDGDLMMTIETKDHPADTGYIRGKKSVERAGPPFNEPTGCALAPEGELYVTDGYGNARVHKFTPDGQLLFSWGEPGNRPGQFNPPHGVCVNEKGLVYISDRMNGRVQVFNSQGKFITQWSDAHFPNNVCIDAEGNYYVAEVGGIFLYSREAQLDKFPPRITVRDSSGHILSAWGEGDPKGSGMYFSPHSIAVDSRGDLYVSEVTTSYTSGQAPKNWGVLRKYVRSQI